MSLDLPDYEIGNPTVALKAIAEALEGEWEKDWADGKPVATAFCWAVACLNSYAIEIDPRFNAHFDVLYPTLDIAFTQKGLSNPLEVLEEISENLHLSGPSSDVRTSNGVVKAFLTAAGSLLKNGRLTEGSDVAIAREEVLADIAGTAQRSGASVGWALAAGSGYYVTVYDADLQPIFEQSYGNHPLSDAPLDSYPNGHEQAMSGEALEIEAQNAAGGLAVEYGLPTGAVFRDTDLEASLAEERGDTPAPRP